MSQLTAEQRCQYLAAGGVYCPFCESTDISGGFVEIDTSGASQRVDCQSCGRHWFDLYRLDDLLTDDEVDEQCKRLSASLPAVCGISDSGTSPAVAVDVQPIPRASATVDILVVVSGGIVQSVYAPDSLRLQIIDFDNLKEGDTFAPDEAYPTDGSADCPAARETVAEALRLSDRHQELIREMGGANASL